MPRSRWRALPDELDPEVREFTEQLRRIVEGSGLSLGAVADRTGYSKTSWERYLGGRLLPPLGAAEALAEVTGTDVGHLGTLWELAERAWSRSELRHDVTMESVRVAEARAALGVVRAPAPREPVTAAPHPGAPRTHADTEEIRAAERPGAAGAQAGALVPRGPAQSPDLRDRAIPDERGHTSRSRITLFVLSAVGAALVILAAVLLLGSGDDDSSPGAAPQPAAPPASGPGPSSSAASASAAPADARCAGAACTGRDPQTTGCGAQASTARTATVGTARIEVRYSAVCGAAWARITKAVPGDTVRISAVAKAGEPARTESGKVARAADGYTPMVAVAGPGEAKACATLTSGVKGCTAAG
ncbi:XRE family transcriptional regulator [Streptomyces gamaensis]|uniref:XRE family transcriptional regulator n=1 Tax=Streptomyces gamaensis TaxID=1763542 RepID=A0ABW0Z5C4_9ACTN